MGVMLVKCNFFYKYNIVQMIYCMLMQLLTDPIEYFSIPKRVLYKDGILINEKKNWIRRGKASMRLEI